MLLPEPRLDALLDQLGTLPAGDRRAILACLSPAERASVRGRLRGVAPRRPASPYSPDLADRLVAAKAGGDVPLTPEGKAALLRALAETRATHIESTGSLLDALVGRLWSRAA